MSSQVIDLLRERVVMGLRTLKGMSLGAVGLVHFARRRLFSKARPKVLILSAGGAHSGSAWLAESASRLGYDSIILAPSFPLREVKWAVDWRIDDPTVVTEDLLDWAKSVDPVAIFSDHRNAFIPVKQALLEAVGGTEFGTLGPATSTNKLTFRSAIDDAEVANVRWQPIIGEIADDFPLPAVIKPTVGTGSRGVKLVESRQDLMDEVVARRSAGEAETTLIEQKVDGRQFDVEGICYRGEFYILSVTEEHYQEVDGNFPSAWFLFSPPIGEDNLKRVRQGALDVCKACGVMAGAFHCEVRLTPDGEVYPIDYSNRYGYPIMVSECSNVNFVEYYMRTLLPLPFTPPKIEQNSVYQEYIIDPQRKASFTKLISENSSSVIEARMLGARVGGVWTFGRVSLKAENYSSMKALLSKYDLMPNEWPAFYANN